MDQNQDKKQSQIPESGKNMQEEKPKSGEDKQPKDIWFSVVLGIVVIVLLGLLLLPTSPQQTSNQPIQEDDVSETDLTSQLVEVGDPTALDLAAGNSLQIPSGWVITAKTNDHQGRGYECDWQNACSLVYINNTSESASLKTIVISSPGSVKLSEGPQTDDGSSPYIEEIRQVAVLGEEADLTYNMFDIVDIVSTGETDPITGTEIMDTEVVSTHPIEVYGCVSDGLCIHVGPLALNAEDNDSQLQELNSFLAQLSME